MEEYKKRVQEKMKQLAHGVYKTTRTFPREELYGIVSQIRRAALSVLLNYLEGFARRKKRTQLQFLEISYGSLQETKCLLDFSFEEGLLIKADYETLHRLADELGAILWSEIRSLDASA